MTNTPIEQTPLTKYSNKAVTAIFVSLEKCEQNWDISRKVTFILDKYVA